MSDAANNKRRKLVKPTKNSKSNELEYEHVEAFFKALSEAGMTFDQFAQRCAREDGITDEQFLQRLAKRLLN